MPRRAGQRRMPHLSNSSLALHPAGECARGGVLRLVAQRHAGQAAQHGLGVITSHAKTHAHVAVKKLVMQRLITRDHRTHQHIAATAGVLGQGLHRDIGTQVKRIEGQACAPGVVDHTDQTFGMPVRVSANDAGQSAHIRKLERDGARDFKPDEARLDTELFRKVLRVHRVVIAVADTPGLHFMLGQCLVRAVGIVGDQQFVTGAQKSHVDQRDGRQSAGHQRAIATAFERGDTRFQREGGGCAGQAVGIAGLMRPVAVAQGRDIGEDDRRGPVNGDGDGIETGRWLVRVVNELGSEVFHDPMLQTLARVQTFHFSISCAGRKAS